MAAFGINSAKSYVGRNVNLHLKDGSVLVNVFFKSITDKRLMKVIGSKRRVTLLPLTDVAYAEYVSPYLEAS
jgi:hypothetical protein